MSYEIYHSIHLISIMLFVGVSGAIFFSSENSKAGQVLAGISNFLILVAGMGLLARLGFRHGEPFPKWVLVKIFLWLVLAVLVPVGAKRLKHKRVLLMGSVLGLTSIAILLVVWKPF